MKEAKNDPAELHSDLVIEPADVRVLVIEDSRTMRTILQANLEAAGFQVAIAEGGQEGLEHVAKHPVDLIILDLLMKDVDGMQVLWEVRDKHDKLELPVIVATASNEEEDVVNAFEMGANDYIRKPIKFPILFARMTTQLQLKFAVQELRAGRKPE